jgi:hypothetical protein
MIASHLELMDLGRVPRTRTVYHDSPLSIRAAIAMLDAGVIAPDLRAPARPQDLLLKGLLGWLGARMSAARSFDLGFRFEEKEGAVHLFLGPPYEGRMSHYSAPERKRLDLHAIGTRCRRAEEMITGLGQTALDVLAEVSAIGFRIWLPQSVEEFSGLAHARFKADVRNIPVWARKPSALDAAALASLSNPKRVKHTGRLARAIVGLYEALSTHRAGIRLTNRKPGRLCVLGLSWEKASDHDYLRRSVSRHVYDNWMFKGEVSERRGSHYASVAIADGPGLAKGIAEFFAGIEPIFPILTAAQKVVDELITKSESSDDD